MPKRIYVGLSKMSRARLSAVAKESRIPLTKLERAVRGQTTLTETELKQVAKALESYPYD